MAGRAGPAKSPVQYACLQDSHVRLSAASDVGWPVSAGRRRGQITPSADGCRWLRAANRNQTEDISPEHLRLRASLRCVAERCWQSVSGACLLGWHLRSNEEGTHWGASPLRSDLRSRCPRGSTAAGRSLCVSDTCLLAYCPVGAPPILLQIGAMLQPVENVRTADGEGIAPTGEFLQTSCTCICDVLNVANRSQQSPVPVAPRARSMAGWTDGADFDE